MKRKLTAGFFALLSFFVWGWTTQAGNGLPRPESEAFWTYITKTNPYVNWGLWPKHQGLVPGMGPHGAYIRIYVNDLARKALMENKPMSPGAIIVKEGYSKDKQNLVAITPMYKVKDFNPRKGDWYWANYAPDGVALASGKVQECINCHRIKKKYDYIFTESK